MFVTTQYGDISPPDLLSNMQWLLSPWGSRHVPQRKHSDYSERSNHMVRRSIAPRVRFTRLKLESLILA